MARPNIKTHHGNRVVVKIDDQFVGLLQNVRFNDDYSPEAISGVGDIHVQEHAPTMARHTAGVSSMVLRKKNMVALGIYPENGDEMLKGLIFDIEVFDNTVGATPTLLRKIIGCTFSGGSIEVAKHTVFVSDANFMGIDVSGTVTGNDISETA